MTPKQTLLIGSLLGALAVALGAFGAHALKELLTRNGRLETYELAVRYHFYHALALLLVGLLMNQYQSPALGRAAWLLLLGVILFSGSLYAYALTSNKVFAMITPIGGLAFLAGWAFLVYAFATKA